MYLNEVALGPSPYDAFTKMAWTSDNTVMKVSLEAGSPSDERHFA